MSESTNDLSIKDSGTAAFSLLHPSVQRRLWDMKWTELRPLQVQAINRISLASGDLIISAATASGKTEAAFLPILSKIADEPLGSVRSLYVGPLKALINDQFARINDLCHHLEMPVHDWHGDVSASRKAKLLECPGGVLLITPESLESIFVNRSTALRNLFNGLRFIVIDELHSFLDNERGLHLRSLLSRLRSVIEQPASVRTIGLSATIGDLSIATRYVNEDQPQDVHTIDDKIETRSTKLRIHGYCWEFEEEDKDDNPSVPDELMRFAQDVVQHCKGKSNLIFANSKGDIEELADLCASIGRDEGINDRFLVHHGSLSAAIREDTEATMKEGKPATAFCTSTLEMGIDIGSVSMIGQVDPPWSVASLKQRIGRSGRRKGESQILRMYIRCHQTTPQDDLFDRLHLQLIQAIAVTELMLERWAEPARLPVCDLSTLTQQIISYIFQRGGARADELHRVLCVAGPFRDISTNVFAQLLRQLVEKDVLEQEPEGDLILGLLGESLRKNKGFYAVFNTPSEYSVIYEGTILGTLSSAPEKGERLLFAGRRWQVIDVDPEKLELHVIPAHGWKRPKFSGSGGEIHEKIRKKMREILLGDKKFIYLDDAATSLLESARSAADISHLSQPLISLGPRKTAIMTWTGTRIQQTLVSIFDYLKVEATDKQIAIVIGAPLEKTRATLQQLCETSFNEKVLAYEMLKNGSGAPRRKYDWLLNPELRVTSLTGWLDVQSAKKNIFEAHDDKECTGSGP